MSKEALIRGLNEDLAAGGDTIMRYTYQAGKTFGLLGAERRELFQAESLDKLGCAQAKWLKLCEISLSAG
jgi:hypothetical protein